MAAHPPSIEVCRGPAWASNTVPPDNDDGCVAARAAPITRTGAAPARLTAESRWPGQMLIDAGASAWADVSIVILRGLAFSLTGMMTESTPLS